MSTTKMDAGLHGWVSTRCVGHVPKVHCHERALYSKSNYVFWVLVIVTPVLESTERMCTLRFLCLWCRDKKTKFSKKKGILHFVHYLSRAHPFVISTLLCCDGVWEEEGQWVGWVECMCRRCTALVAHMGHSESTHHNTTTAAQLTKQ